MAILDLEKQAAAQAVAAAKDKVATVDAQSRTAQTTIAQQDQRAADLRGQLASLEPSAAAAQAARDEAKRKRDEAQAALESKAADEPDATIERDGRPPIRNPAHLIWEKQMSQARTALATAEQALQTAEAQLSSVLGQRSQLQRDLTTATAAADAARKQLSDAQAAGPAAAAALRSATAAAARIDAWVAAISGPPGAALDTAVADLLALLRTHEDASGAAADQARTADEAAWRLGRRSDELAAELAAIDARLSALAAQIPGQRTASNAAAAALDAYLQRITWDAP